MQTKPELIESLKHVTEKLPEDDLQEIRVYAEYLNAKRLELGAYIGIDEFLEKHEEHARLMLGIILQRSRLISMVNRLAQIILSAKNVSDMHRAEAEEALKKVSWTS